MKLHIGQSDLVSLKPADRAVVLGQIKDFGFDKVRFEVPFHAWTWPGSKYNWTPVRKTAEDLYSAGLEALPVLGAHRPLFWKPTAKQYGAWCATAVSAVRASLPDLTEVEVWNEPNLINFWSKADPTTFYPYAQAAYESIKALWPNLTVVLAGMAAAATGPQWPFIGGPKDPVSFVLALQKAAGGKKFYDRLAYHPYNLNEGFQLAKPDPDLFGIKALSRMQALTPGNEVLVTEIGYQTTGKLGDYHDLEKSLHLIGERDEVYLYCWRDADREKFGLVDGNNTPKRPYYDLVKQLVGRPGLDPGIQA